jgi:predicted nuclease of predicted toxin-antitoxin system
MKFLLDVCASSRSLRKLLADLGHEVVSVVDVDRRASDEALLNLALREGRVFVTEDKDFGELVFVRRLPHPTIIRFVEMRVEDQVAAMQELLDRYPAELEAKTLIVATRGRIRIRH